jgi:hypothetical protein
MTKYSNDLVFPRETVHFIFQQKSGQSQGLLMEYTSADQLMSILSKRRVGVFFTSAALWRGSLAEPQARRYVYCTAEQPH